MPSCAGIAKKTEENFHMSLHIKTKSVPLQKKFRSISETNNNKARYFFSWELHISPS